MSELTFAGAGGAERAIDIASVESPNVTRGDALLFQTVREVEEKDCQGGGHPIEVKAWVLDGPDEGTHEESLWVWPKGMRDKLNKAPGSFTAGRLETYKAYGSAKVGLTTMTDAQRAKAAAKVEELKAAGSETPSKATSDDSRPPF